MVQDAVQDRRGNDAVPEYLAPGAEALVGGEDHGAFLIAPADELEEQVGAGLVDGEIADLINDQQSGDDIGLEFLVEFTFGQGFAEGGDHVGGGGKQYPVALLNGFEAESDRQVCLADAGGSRDDDVLTVLDEVAVGEVAQLFFIQGGLVAEVEGVQAFDEREAGHVGTHGDVPGGLGAEFFGEQLVQELGIGPLLLGGVLEQGFEALEAFGEAQFGHLFPQPFQLARVHAGTAVGLFASVSYTAGSRTSTSMLRGSPAAGRQVSA